MLRRFLFRAGWRLAWPLRAYLRRVPAHPGRAWLEALLVRLLFPLAPPTFVASLPGGATIELRYREQIGLSTLLNGTFEAAESAMLTRLARPGTMAIDAGANVGLHTLQLARAVGPQGRVLAFEPAVENARRLASNVRRNGLENVTIVQSALGSRPGTVALSVEEDGAYNSTVAATRGRQVPVDALDAVWDAEGRPHVSVLKLDVEGAELDVLAGATALLDAEHPAVLVEAAEPAGLDALRALLEPHDYRSRTEAGFQPWNHLFTRRD